MLPESDDQKSLFPDGYTQFEVPRTNMPPSAFVSLQSKSLTNSELQPILGSSLPKPANDNFTFDESDFDTVECSNNRESTPTNSLNIRVELNSGGIQVFDTKPGKSHF